MPPQRSRLQRVLATQNLYSIGARHCKVNGLNLQAASHPMNKTVEIVQYYNETIMRMPQSLQFPVGKEFKFERRDGVHNAKTCILYCIRV